jgi:pyruvate dehydrogenase complex dehydrogenase (E1) component
MLQKTADIDPVETAEWRDAFANVVQLHGPERARYLLDQLVALAHQQHINWSRLMSTRLPCNRNNLTRAIWRLKKNWLR